MERLDQFDALKRKRQASSIHGPLLTFFSCFVLHIPLEEEIHSPKIFMEPFFRTQPISGDLTNVDPKKLQDLETFLTTILALPTARDTFAQIIGGRPTRTPYSVEIKKSKDPSRKTIINGNNVKPSREAVQRFDEIKAAFSPQDLIIDLQVRRLSMLILCSNPIDLV